METMLKSDLKDRIALLEAPRAAPEKTPRYLSLQKHPAEWIGAIIA
jgi:hypothetical protein